MSYRGERREVGTTLPADEIVLHPVDTGMSHKPRIPNSRLQRDRGETHDRADDHVSELQD